MPSIAIIGSRGYGSTYGGFETLVSRLAPFLASAGHDVTVYGRAGSLKRVTSEHVGTRLRSVVVPGFDRNRASTLTHGAAAISHAMLVGYDVALVLNIAHGHLLPLCRARGIPTVVNVDGLEWERAKWGRWAKAVFRSSAYATARYADHIVVDAMTLDNVWKCKFGRSTHFIPYGGDVIHRTPDQIGQFGLTPGSYVLLVARLVPENSIDLFVSAIPLLQTKVPIVVVGDAPGTDTEAAVREASLRLASVKWLGRINNRRVLDDLWRGAGVYFHGHTVGGTNPALVQAMAAGSPIVAVESPFNREVLGSAGLIVDRDAEQVAKALDTVLQNRDVAAAMSQAGQCRASANYRWEAVCASYESLLRGAATLSGTK